MHKTGTPVFAAAAQGIPLNHLALVANGAYARKSHRTKPKSRTVFNQLFPQVTAQSKQTETPVCQSYSERGIAVYVFFFWLRWVLVAAHGLFL